MDESNTEKSPFSDRKAGQAFLINPTTDEKGRGVLVLHSWWGLNEWTKQFCERLADVGYTVLAPDLLAGELPENEVLAEDVLAKIDPDELSSLVISSAHTLRAASIDPTKPIAIIGFSMGASLAMWAGTRLGQHSAAVVSFYGSQSIDFDEAQAAFQGHYGTDDHLVSEEERVLTESFIGLGDNETNFYTYDGVGHWFFEKGQTGYDEQSAELAWQRTLQLLETKLKA